MPQGVESQQSSNESPEGKLPVPATDFSPVIGLYVWLIVLGCANAFSIRSLFKEGPGFVVDVSTRYSLLWGLTFVLTVLAVFSFKGMNVFSVRLVALISLLACAANYVLRFGIL